MNSKTWAGPKLAHTPVSYYVLGYYTTNPNMDNSYRRIDITLSRYPSATLRHRAGYFGPGAVGTIAAGFRNMPGNDITPPVALVHPDPEYSEDARKAKYSGTAELSVEVDETGGASSIRVARSLGMGLDEKAMESVTRWRFKPAMKDGTPIAVPVQAEVNFRLL